MSDPDDLHVLDRHNLLLSDRANTGDSVLGEPPLKLSESILLRRIQRLGHLRVQGGHDQERLRCDNHPLREPM